MYFITIKRNYLIGNLALDKVFINFKVSKPVFISGVIGFNFYDSLISKMIIWSGYKIIAPVKLLIRK